jgi:hypothetical protein
MAKIKEELLIIKVSTIHKNNGESKSVLTDELVSTLEQVISELLGDSAVVEVETINEDE